MPIGTSMDVPSLFEGKPFSIQKQVVEVYDHVVRHRYLSGRRVLRLEAPYFSQRLRDEWQTGRR